MAASLENRSSLRKLDFPQSTQEALLRLYGTFSAFSGSSTSLSMPPKETEIILDVIDEFVFLNKPSKSRKTTTNQIQMSNIQELQLMQVLMDFFLSHSSSEAEIVPLANLFNYLFMDPPVDVQGISRTDSLSKFSVLALGLKCQPVLQCLGLWLQNATQDKSKALVLSLVKDYILLIPDKPNESLKSIPILSPIFAAHFLNSVADLYSPFEKPLPPVAMDLFLLWLEASNSDKMLPLKGFMTQLGLHPMSWTNMGLTPLIGLSKWSILGPVLSETNEKPCQNAYTKLHLILLECLAEACDQKSLLLKTDLIPVVKLVSLVNCVQAGIANETSVADTDHCLDRLGQFLLCLLASKLVYGKMIEVTTSISRIPVYKSRGNRLLKMFIQRAK